MRESRVIKDIYGSFTISEPVLLELLDSRAIQRLKGIAQYGVPHELYWLPGFTRYEHSVGVMLLLRKLDASIEEQVVGLLHDASHTAFSHVIDWVIGNKNKEDFQDKNHKTTLKKFGVQQIVEKHGFDFDKVCNVESFSLLEREAPDLCADRVDYALREFKLWAEPSILQLCIDNLSTHDGEIVFSSQEAAGAFARAYLKCQREHWGGAEYVLRYECFSRMLKYAISENIIVFDDFYEDDNYIMKKLHACKDTFIQDQLEYLRNNFQFKKENKQPQFTLKKKFRYVDPQYIAKNTVHRLSENDNKFNQFLLFQQQLNEEGIKVTLIQP